MADPVTPPPAQDFFSSLGGQPEQAEKDFFASVGGQKETPPKPSGALTLAWEGAKKVAKDMWELAPSPGEQFDAATSWKNLLMPGVGMGIQLIQNKPRRFDYTVEVGLPLVAQIATAEFSPAAQAAVGGITGSVGNALAQGRRVMAGEQKGFEAGQWLQNTSLSAIPIIGSVKVAGLTGAALKTAKVAALPAAGAATTAGRTLLDEGRLPTKEEVIFAAGLPAALHVASMPVGLAGRVVSKKIKDMAEKEARMNEAGVKPTLGMIDTQFAQAEQRIAERQGIGRPLPASIEDAHKDMKAFLADAATPKAEIFEMGTEYYDTLNRAQKVRDSLSEEAKAAVAASREAQDKLMLLRNVVDKETREALEAEASKKANESFLATVSSTVKNAQDLARDQLQGNTPLLNPAVAADAAYDRVISPMFDKKVGAFPVHFNEQYSKFDPNIPVYDVGALGGALKEAESRVTEGVPTPLGAAVSMAKKFMAPAEEGGATPMRSLGDLRSLRDKLYSASQGNIPGGDRSAIIQMARAVSDLINNGADDAAGVALSNFGKEWDAEALRAVNAGYRRYSDLLELPGVADFLDKDTAKLTVNRALSEMDKSGAQAVTFDNLSKVINYASEISPELGETLRRQRNDIFKGALFQRFAEGNFDEASGGYLVSPSKLANWMAQVEQASPGTLKELGLGDKGTANALKALADAYPHASKPTDAQLASIFRNPLFQASMEAQKFGGKAPKDVLNHFLGQAMADSQTKNLADLTANLASMGKLEEAKAVWAEARQRVVQSGRDLAKADAVLVELGEDPLKVAFSSAGLNPKSYDDLAKFLKDPNTPDKWVQSFVDGAKATEQGQAFLDEIRAREVADYFAEEAVASPSYVQTPTVPNYQKIAEFHQNDIPLQDARRRLGILLDEESLRLLDERSRMSRDFLDYAKGGKAPSDMVAGRVPVNSVTRKALGLIESALKNGEYRVAAWLLIDSEGRLGATAQALQKAGEAASKGAPQAVSFLTKKGETLPRVGQAAQEQESQTQEPPMVQFHPPENSPLLQQLRASRPTE